jgi:hypothetical protein
MSEVREHGNITSLEDLFLSREFGKPEMGMPTPGPDDTRFGALPPRAPLIPLVARPIPGGHASTTHLRTNRMVASVSGIAAALLIAVGFISGAAKSGNGNKPVSAIGPTTTTPTGGGKPIGGSGFKKGVTPAPGPAAPGSSPNSTPVVLSSFTTGGTGTGNHATPPTGRSGDGGTGIPTTSPATTPTPATAPAGTLLSPVINLVGNVVATTGNTVSGVSTTVGTVLPPVAPVTGLVGGLGGTLSGLGQSLITSA